MTTCLCCIAKFTITILRIVSEQRLCPFPLFVVQIIIHKGRLPDASGGQGGGGVCAGEGGGEACDEVGFIDEGVAVEIVAIHIARKERACGPGGGPCGAGGALQFGGDTAEARVGQCVAQTAFATRISVNPMPSTSTTSTKSCKTWLSV